MSKINSPKSETIKMIAKEEGVLASNNIITSSDARRSQLPKNCIVVPMRVLKKPEPIKSGRK